MNLLALGNNCTESRCVVLVPGVNFGVELCAVLSSKNFVVYETAGMPLK
jgi:hypothetical protein